MRTSDPTSEPHRLNPGDLVLGDVVLGYSSMTASEMRVQTGCGYSHAAICIAPSLLADASGGGVRRVEVVDLMNEYDHLAVFRQPYRWSRNRADLLHEFVDSRIRSGARFNGIGMRELPARKSEHDVNVYGALENFFEGSVAAPSSLRERYFCSEFVAAAFVHVGTIDSSAAVLLDPAVTSPGGLSEEPAYGYFAGYLLPNPGYAIPDGDDFICEKPLHQWVDQP